MTRFTPPYGISARLVSRAIFKQNYKQNKMVLKIEEVKDCIGFDLSNGIGKTLELMVDLWHKKALSEGLSDREAVMVAFDNLSNLMVDLWHKKALSEGLSDREAVMVAFDNLSNKITEMAKTIQ